ncbi:GNAT family N-acetyltransferase [Oerskovia enterophila]|uniref:Mycothiol acetyltransferase n=1 Tax=Oerskovia enterophila TaxID=43678 RepID=A0ABX2Y059_9CELL|nr:GNAT family N-acetyltransferase [Oerskovia enterophila]OCI29922.1 mycothiol acetyltransferase [Oerskovia enterophila]
MTSGTGRATSIEVAFLDDLADDAPSRAELLRALRDVTGAPGQDVFSASADQILTLAEADPDRHALVVRRDGQVAGVGVLHPGGASDEMLDRLDGARPQDVVVFRGFLVDRHHQGVGVGSSVAAALPALVARLAERLRRKPFASVVLVVDADNAAGLRAYTRAGFVDRGAYLDAVGRTQHVMALAVV